MDDKWALGGMSKTEPKADQPAPVAPVAVEPVLDAAPAAQPTPDQPAPEPVVAAPEAPAEPVVAAVTPAEPVIPAPAVESAPPATPAPAEPAPVLVTPAPPKPTVTITPPAKPVAVELPRTPEPTPPPAPPAAPPPRRSRVGAVLTGLVGIVALAAIGTSAWVYTETQRDVARLTTEIAQFRLSLELFNRQQSAASGTAVAAPTAAPDATQLQSLADRLSALEQSAQSQPAPTAATAPTALPPTPGTTSSANADDCLPPGTRLLVTAGDSYPICGVEGAAVNIGSISNGFLVLSDGPTIASGATIKLPGTQCNIGVMSSGDGGLSNYAEIRVTC